LSSARSHATYPLDKAMTAFGYAQRAGAMKILVKV
jgi:hypothetical protein